MEVTHASRHRILELVASKVKQVDVVLDLGPGILPQPFIKPQVHICVDAYRPYLERLNRKPHPNYVLINAKWDEFIAMLPDKSVDTVFALDIIEHLEKDEGLRMLREAERVARRQIVVQTPHGFFPQSYEDPNKADRWGMDGGYWQTHRSGWEFEDFGELWEIVYCRDFITHDEDDLPLENRMGAMWAFRNLPITDLEEAPVERRTTVELLRTILEQGLPPIALRGVRSALISLRHVTNRIP